MKKYLQIFVALVAMTYGVSSWAFGVERYLEGVHYSVAPNGKPAPHTVVEFFSFGCPHCAHLEPGLEQWLKTKPANVTFTRVPATWNPYFEFMGRVYYAMKDQGIDKSAAADLFDHIHKKGLPMRTKEDVESFIVSHGGDKAKFEKFWSSAQMEKDIEDAGKTFARYQVSGVPTILVDGQYMTSESQAGSETGLFKVINFLLEDK